MIRLFLLVGPVLLCALSCTSAGPQRAALAPSMQTAKKAEPELSRDELVMNAALVDFLKDRDKEPWTIGSSTRGVVLHIRNPAKLGILDQTEGDIQGRKLSPELLKALRVRNTGKNWVSVPFSYKGFRLNKRVTIKDLWVGPKDSLNLTTFKGYKGYFEAFAPGFSKDGERACVRAWVGPSSHGATVTYALELRKGIWKVLWREYSFYA